MKKPQKYAPKSFNEYLERIATMVEEKNTSPKGEVEKIIRKSNVYRTYFYTTDENIQMEYRKRLASINLCMDFDGPNNLFVIKRINPNRKYAKTNGLIQKHLELCLNNALKNSYIIDILDQQDMKDEIKGDWLSNFYHWILDLDLIIALYSLFKYKHLAYFSKALSTYNNKDANVLNGGDTLKSVKSEVQPALTVQEQKAKIFNQQKTKRSKNHIKDQVVVYNSDHPFIITDPEYTPEQQTLIYTFIAIAQKKSMLPEFENSYNEYREWYYKNAKNKDAKLNAPIEGMTAFYKDKEFFELMGLKLNKNSNDRKIIQDWMDKTLETLGNIRNQPFQITYIKNKGNKGNTISLYFKLDINTAPYILNLKGVQYEIIQGYFRAKTEVDLLRPGNKKTALYDIINFKVKTITEYKNPEYIDRNIEDYIKDRATTVDKNESKEFKSIARAIVDEITTKTNNLIPKI